MIPFAIQCHAGTDAEPAFNSTMAEMAEIEHEHYCLASSMSGVLLWTRSPSTKHQEDLLFRADLA